MSLAIYKPVSFLPSCSRTLGKIIYDRLVAFLHKHNLITHAQFGFRKNSSTELTLLNQKYYIQAFQEKNLI